MSETDEKHHAGTVAGTSNTRKSAASDRERLEVSSRAALRVWLSQHHSTSPGVWVVTHKKAAGGTVFWNDIVEEALCFGWIDSLPRKLDDERTMLLVTPRSPQSGWSAKNKAHVECLEQRGLMQPSGRAAVELSKANGTWTALDQASTLQEPAELLEALNDHPNAAAHWNAFPPSIRRAILEWISQARRPETRAQRLRETARLAELNQRAHQWRK